MFSAAVFTWGTTCLGKHEWIKKQWYIYRNEYYSARKRKETGSLVDESSVRHKEWSKSGREKQISVFTFIWNLEQQCRRPYLQGVNCAQRTDVQPQQGKERESERKEEWHGQATTRTADSWWEAAVPRRELSLVLCECLERWGGGSRGKGYMHTYSWFTPTVNRNQHNIGNQLSSNSKKKKMSYIYKQWNTAQQ